jgi:hypothetical protein
MCRLRDRALLFLASASLTRAVRVVNTTVLGLDPQTVNRLNGESYQQDALIIFQGMFIQSQ